MIARLAVVLAFLWLATWPGGTAAQPRTDPDWPCVQRKVPTISAGAVWSGPDPGAAGEWNRDAEAAALAQKLASRRTDIDAFGHLIDEFAQAAGADKQQRLTRLFAGVLDLVNRERDRILQGIERYARGQRLLADRLREASDRISAARDSPGAEPTADIKDVELQFAWDKRIFDERRQSLSYVCEMPVLLEKRVFDTARLIQEHL